MKTRWMTWMASGLVLLCSCGTSDKETAETPSVQSSAAEVEEMTREADKIVEQEMENMQKQEAATFPCSVFTQEEIEALAGNPLDKGSYMFENRTEDDRVYKSESCAWSAKGGQGNEVSLQVSLAKHFDSGQVVCYPPLGAEDDNPWAPKKVSGVGDQAWCAELWGRCYRACLLLDNKK
ncbi:MAG: hypothetical protein AABY87_03265 [bacterium]